ncbi:rhodanese-like domain-containing protein [Rufibacter quisquiliarum]|uniref:Rhodanese-related sulfurtransferase n=1 Tax=Rufibacter quisquiliarum TaxID=1549639 RepID=A0A839GW10_9BACT|nr:rhodanese-related sulfurtransferase [Rufibacter quisquiliarum]
MDPKETFYLIAQDDKTLEELIDKASRIGYESKIRGAFALEGSASVTSPKIDVTAFKENPDKYTVVDIRNASEVKEKQYFPHALNIPLPELRDRAQEIPTGKPVVIHCAGGYRSAAGSSIVEARLPKAEVLDLSEAISQFNPL